MGKPEDNKAVVGRWFTESWGKSVNLGVVDEIAAGSDAVVDRIVSLIEGVILDTIAETGASRRDFIGIGIGAPVLLVAARLQGFDPALERAASDLGANTYRRLRYVVLPLIMPAVFAGALFAFTLSLDEFIITLFLIGAHNTLPIYIYTQVKFGITPEVNALATLLLAASLCLIALAFVLPMTVRRVRRLVRA